MSYGAKESNAKEGSGLLLVVAGLSALSAGWAYAGGGVQILLVLLGLAGIAGGLATLQRARAES
ncbi:MAG TPA: hypothetical protein VGK54_04425 [Chloroflexota bacterium]